MAKHDENKDIRLLSRVARIDYPYKTIKAAKSATIGIRSWGRIDYLCNHRGWVFVWDNSAVVNNTRTDDSDDKPKRKKIVKKVKEEQPKTKNKKR